MQPVFVDHRVLALSLILVYVITDGSALLVALQDVLVYWQMQQAFATLKVHVLNPIHVFVIMDGLAAPVKHHAALVF